MGSNEPMISPSGPPVKARRRGKSGAELIGVPMTRRVPYYPLTESDIVVISVLNSIVPLILSFGTGILGFGISKFADLSFVTVPDDQKRWAYAVPVGSLVIGGALILLAIILARMKKSTKDEILAAAKRETELGY